MKWGRLLHDAAMPVAHTANVMNAWAKIGDHAGRRFSVHVDAALEAGAPEAEVKTAQEAATLLLGLPWELLHDGNGYLFQGAKPTRVRRRLPNTQGARRAGGRHRPSASCSSPRGRRTTPAATSTIAPARCRWSRRWSRSPGLVRIHVLSPPTLPALARRNSTAPATRSKPYHVVHFDGHGVYDRTVGLGGLCFEQPEDIGKLEQRRHVTVYTRRTRPAAARSPHPARLPRSLPDRAGREGVRVRRLRAAEGGRGLGGRHEPQRAGRDRAPVRRGVLPGAGRAANAWATPCSPASAGSRTTPSAAASSARASCGSRTGSCPCSSRKRTTRSSSEDHARASRRRRTSRPRLPPASASCRRCRRPASSAAAGSCSRSSGCCATSATPWCAARAAKARPRSPPSSPAGWSARSRCAAPRSSRSRPTAMRARCSMRSGRQLVGEGLLRRAFGDLEKAIQPSRARAAGAADPAGGGQHGEHPPAAVRAQETPEALSEDAREELTAILALCARLLQVGDTRLVFTSREALPAPFDAERHRRELHQLDREDAVKLVERVLNAAGGDAGASQRCRARGDRAARGGRPLPRPHAGAAGPGAARAAAWRRPAHRSSS